ncbi:MAG TPA: glutathione transferase, partial [Polyangiaceae bacterium]|nr:glutathione transferase [Polyangiaceae bacterium]
MTRDLILYGNTPVTSPFVCTVFVALEEKGLTFQHELLDLNKGQQHEESFVQHSITNRVPTLRHGEFWLSESTAIAEYLDEAFPAPQYPRLYPTDVKERARVRMIQGLVRSDFADLRKERSTETFLHGQAYQTLSASTQRSADRLLRIAEQVLEGRASIASEFSIADVDLALMLAR